MRSFPDGILADPETVARYADDMESGNKFPPVKCTSDGETYWLYDGFARMAAIEQNGRLGSVEAEVTPGDYRDALFLSLGANRDHGRQRTNEDRQRAVETLLFNDDLVAKARKAAPGRGGLHAALAAAVGVSESTVSRYLGLNGLRISGNKIEKKDTPPPPPPTQAPGGRDTSPIEQSKAEPEEDGDAASAFEEDDEDQDAGEPEEDDDAEPAWTAPPARSQYEVIADMVATFRSELEKFAETRAGRELLGWTPEGDAGPLVVNLLDLVADGVRRDVAKARGGYTSNRDRGQFTAVAHGVAVTGGADAQDLPPGTAGCPLLRKLEEKVRSMGRAAKAAA